MDVFARLPDHIELDLNEAHGVLIALDIGLKCAAAEDHDRLEWAVHLITAKLWPELGDLLGGERT